MSVFDNRNFQGDFPFSASLLRHVSAQAGQDRPGDATSGGGDQGENPAPDGREIADVPPPRPAAGGLTQPRRPRPSAGRILPPPPPLRLLRLETFVWGGAALPPEPRTRPDHTLIWITEGRLHLDFPRRHHLMQDGDLRHIPPGTAFAAMPAGHVRGHVLLVPAALARSTRPALPRDGLAGHAGAAARDLRVLLTCLGKADAARTATLLDQLSQRLQQLDALPPGRPPVTRRTPDAGLLGRYLKLAEARLGEVGSLADLADELGTTTALLDLACLGLRGRRAIDLWHDLRLERAVALLRHTPQSPAEIAAGLGYSSLAHFTRAFVAATGRTPEAFRAQPC